MTITSLNVNRHRRAFEVSTERGVLPFPFAKADPLPTPEDPAVDAYMDEELGGEGFTFSLASGREGSVQVDQVLDYNRDPEYLRDQLLYKLTLEAERRAAASPLSRRELIRRLGTSASQFYRLLDPTSYRKSVDGMLELLQVLDCEVDLVVRPAGAPRR
ncbi:MAG: hypothetical protein JW990_06330 [Thermoleophilia bacterium]|nr:hypothetical protein [Thermoleophilia bacterium]